MFHPFQKSFLAYYIGLVFMAFPILGIAYFDYPLWTSLLSLLFLVAYLALIHLKKGHPIMREILWLIILSYICYMTCFVNGNMMWFFFYPSNLFVWKFNEKWLSYRGLSLLIAIGIVSLYGILSSPNPSDKIAIGLLVLFVLGMTVFMVQTRDEERLKEELYQKTQENMQLVAENERNRIGRDLHDTLGHTFAMMTLKTELALKQLENENVEAVHKELIELQEVSRTSMKEVRQLVNNLKYRTVTEELENIRHMFALSNIDLHILNTADTSQLSPVLQSSICMILRELTTNIIKHAHATESQIILKRTDRIIIQVGDDGQGFSTLTGNELHSIKERLQLVQGQVDILSPAHPTLIQVSLEEKGAL